MERVAKRRKENPGIFPPTQGRRAITGKRSVGVIENVRTCNDCPCRQSLVTVSHAATTDNWSMCHLQFVCWKCPANSANLNVNFLNFSTCISVTRALLRGPATRLPSTGFSHLVSATVSPALPLDPVLKSKSHTAFLKALPLRYSYNDSINTDVARPHNYPRRVSLTWSRRPWLLLLSRFKISQFSITEFCCDSVSDHRASSQKKTKYIGVRCVPLITCC